MKSIHRWAVLALLLAASLPLGAADEKKDPKGKKAKGAEPDPKAKADKVLSGGQFVGTLTKMEAGSQRDFTVQISIQYLEINPQALQQQQQILLQQRQALLNPNPIQRRQTLIQLAIQLQQSQQNLYQVKEVKQDVDLRAAEDIKIRTLAPPIDYDDKGNVKKYTKKELLELKGAGNLPGYTGDFEALRAKQIVKVYLAKKKASNPRKGKKDDALDKDDELESSRLKAVMVVVLREPPPAK